MAYINSYGNSRAKTLAISELSQKDIVGFFNNKEDGSLFSKGVLFAMYQMLSPYYLAISKTFEKVYLNLDKDSQDEIINKEKYYNLRTLIKIKYNKAYMFAKKAIGSDII